MVIRRGAPALVLLVVSTVVVAPAASAEELRYRPPVDAPVADPFREPETRFGPGNRGLTYDLRPATPVHASAPGAVVFAGPVAGKLHVTLLHADGLRTSYSFLEAIAVRRGEAVAAGALIGHGGVGFHFGVRDGDVYLDPATLFGATVVRVRLVPHDEPGPGARVRDERRALAAVVAARHRASWLWDELRDRADDTVARGRAALEVVAQLDPNRSVLEALMAVSRSFSEPCTPPGHAAPAPARGHVAVLVGGYGSSSGHAAVDDVDTAALGYTTGDVVRYSYAGGRVPDATDDDRLGSIPARPYAPADTFGDLVAEGQALADVLESVSRARPGATVDLIAHSQGGIVARLAIVELARRGNLGPVSALVTVGSPHAGTELTTGAAALGPGHGILDSLQALADVVGAALDVDATSVLQMAETSALLAELDATKPPPGVNVRTIGAVGDLVVPADKTRIDGVGGTTVGVWGATAHGRLPGDQETTRELALALAGAPPTCRSVWSHVVDAAVPEAISFAESAVVAPATLAWPPGFPVRAARS